MLPELMLLPSLLHRRALHGLGGGATEVDGAAAKGKVASPSAPVGVVPSIEEARLPLRAAPQGGSPPGGAPPGCGPAWTPPSEERPPPTGIISMDETPARGSAWPPQVPCGP